MDDLVPILLLAALGAYHGINPGMGWLFAVALGLQERSRSAVVRALGPIALGHAVSVAAIVLLFALAGSVVSTETLRAVGGLSLIAFGVYKLFAPFSHPRWVGMRVKGRELVAWSFLMATAHGAGLMLIPLVLDSNDSATAAAQGGHAGHVQHVGSADTSASRLDDLFSIGVHTAVMFAVMALIAIVVYEKLGLAVLRKAWFNLDRVWAGTLVSAGVLTVVL